jgi:hypothetical protein
MWTYLGILFVTEIERPPEIGDYWLTKPLFCTPWYGQKSFFHLLQQVFEFIHFADNEVRQFTKGETIPKFPCKLVMPCICSRKRNANR